jgi:hypothetical protein
MYRQFYPTLFWKFLSGNKPVLQINVPVANFLTFADSLWALCISENIPKGSTFLLPDFYCSDVTHFLTKIGYNFKYYELDHNLQVVKKDLIQKINQYNPSMIVLLDALGIRCNLARNSHWIKEQCTKGIYIIEDRVHSLTNPSTVQMYHNRHITIDTLYKVSPFICSRVIAQNEVIIKLNQVSTDLLYSSKVILVHTWYQFLLHTAYLLKNTSIQKRAEKVLTFLCEKVIGFSKKPGKTNKVNQYFSNHINYSRAYSYKKKQLERNLHDYQHDDVLKKFSKVLPYRESESHLLRGLPLYIKADEAVNFITTARKHELLVSLELGDSPWAQKHSASYWYC